MLTIETYKDNTYVTLMSVLYFFDFLPLIKGM